MADIICHKVYELLMSILINVYKFPLDNFRLQYQSNIIHSSQLPQKSQYFFACFCRVIQEIPGNSSTIEYRLDYLFKKMVFGFGISNFKLLVTFLSCIPSLLENWDVRYEGAALFTTLNINTALFFFQRCSNVCQLSFSKTTIDLVSQPQRIIAISDNGIYYMDNGVSLEHTRIELIRHYIQDQVRVFSAFHHYE